MALRVLLLSDGRPGHFRQSETIVRALSRRRDVEVHRLELSAHVPRGLIGRLWQLLPARTFLSLVHGLRPEMLDADLIVSAGAATLGANAALAGLLGVPNIFAGSPRMVGTQRLSLVLTPYATEAAQQNTAYGLKPSPVDPDRLPAARSWSDVPERPALSLLLGGPTNEVRLRPDDWQRLADLVSRIAAAWNARWAIVSSRRTPEAAYTALRPLAAVSPDIAFIDYRDAGVGSIGPALGADALFVTSDSLSMISEAVAARRPVVVLEPRETLPTPDARAIRDLAAEHRLAVMRIEEATPEHLAVAIARVEPLRENHLDLLAETLVSRLGL